MKRKRMVFPGYYLFILVFCHIMLGSLSLRHHHGRTAAAILSAEEVTVGGLSSSISPKIFPLSSSQINKKSTQRQQQTIHPHQQHSSLQKTDEKDESELMSISAYQADAVEDSQQQHRRKLRNENGNHAKDFEGESSLKECDTCLLSENDSKQAEDYDSDKKKPGSDDITSASTLKLDESKENIISASSFNSFTYDESQRKDKLKAENANSREIMNDEPNTALLSAAPVSIHIIKVKPGHDHSTDTGPTAVHLEHDGRPLTPSTTSSLQVTVREKENMSIQCVVEGGNPPPKVIWFVGSVNMTNRSQISAKYSEASKIYITRSTLILSNISRTAHNKTVLCVVDHELHQQAGESVKTSAITEDFKISDYSLLAKPSLRFTSANMKAIARINVEYAPSFVISRIPGFGYPIREGISMALKCEVDANPKSSPQWVKDGGKPPVPQSPDGFLNFTEVSRNHSGWYKCISRHPHGNYSSVGYYLTVRYEPTITHQPAPRVEAKLGSKLKMKCEADGRPSPALCWSRIGYGGSLTTVGSGQDLVLDKILYQEAGNYRCVAQNRVGLEEKRAQTSDILVVVTGPPVIYPTNRTIMGFAGQPLSLSVEMCANPPPNRAFWVFGNVALRPGSKHENKYVAQKLSRNDRATDCYLAVLTILNASEEDAGEYTFFVRNSNGVYEGTVLLDITPASYSVSVSNSRAYGDSPLYPASSSSTLSNFSHRILIFTLVISVIMPCLINVALLVPLLFAILASELCEKLNAKFNLTSLKSILLSSTKTKKIQRKPQIGR